MSVSISQIVADAAQVALTFGEDVLHIDYSPTKMSPALIAELGLLDAKEGVEKLQGVVRVLSGLLIHWDLLDELGNEIPTTAEALMTLPVHLLMRVLSGVFEDIRLGETSGATPK